MVEERLAEGLGEAWSTVEGVGKVRALKPSHGPIKIPALRKITNV